jgi:3-hydroxyacyl-[acyl-carrier-protein] dehydratase
VSFAAPLRAVDEVSTARAEGGVRIVATKAIVGTDPYLAGHFPGHTIFPGVFLIEAVRQAVAAATGSDADITELTSARFLAPLLPGDVATIEALAEDPDDDGQFAVEARCVLGNGVTAARLKVRLRNGGPA